MPISPQDFELYSRMTGRSLPRDPAERMRMAPEVYDFTRNFGREPNVLQKAGNLVGNVGRNIASGIGAGMRLGFELENQERNRQVDLEKERIRAGARESKAEDMLRNFAEKERIKKENRMEMTDQTIEGKIRIKEAEQEAKMKRDQKLADLKQRANENRGMRGEVIDITDAVESQDFDSPREVFDQENALDRLEAFSSINGANFYGFPLNTRRITLEKRQTLVPESISYLKDKTYSEKLVPFHANEELSWSVQLD